ncbi:hypothetical protein [Kribbia dieselivorans]|uniref:hypothetical protein n=1 Tax=Kribbia dieselivorans TaxID=331526 RepID=UPI0008388EEA|nr:hypothetical protein [Kribbia dieselivorans]
MPDATPHGATKRQAGSRHDVTALENLVRRTQLSDIRLQAFSGAVIRTPPEDISVTVTPATPRFARDEGAIIALFSHRIDYTGPDPRRADDDETPVGHLETTHLVEVSLAGDDAPSDESIEAFLSGNVLFMVYPYIRAALHRLPSEFGLPPVLLPYLRRDTLGVVLADEATPGSR